MATGSAEEFGAALRAVLIDLGGAARKKSYRAKGWRAQLAGLRRTRAGRSALAGIATPRTIAAWAKRSPSKRNVGLIAQAYAALAGGFPPFICRQGAQILITGTVDIGDDSRVRGEGGRSRFLVDGSEPPADWTRIRDGWEAGTITDRELDRWFTEDVVENDPDLKDLSQGSVEFTTGPFTIDVD